tara:strand:+ start:648 stop:1460 length:813 start_codon:yes stop_codon:yes gene_type:complete
MDFDLKYHKELNSLENHMYKTLRGSGKKKRGDAPVPNRGDEEKYERKDLIETKGDDEPKFNWKLNPLYPLPAKSAKKLKEVWSWVKRTGKVAKGVMVNSGNFMKELYRKLGDTYQGLRSALRLVGPNDMPLLHDALFEIGNMYSLFSGEIMLPTEDDGTPVRYSSYSSFYKRLNEKQKDILKNLLGYENPNYYPTEIGPGALPGNANRQLPEYDAVEGNNVVTATNIPLATDPVPIKKTILKRNIIKKKKKKIKHTTDPKTGEESKTYEQ